MKKLTILFMLAIFSATIFTGCEKEKNQPAGVITWDQLQGQWNIVSWTDHNSVVYTTCSNFNDSPYADNHHMMLINMEFGMYSTEQSMTVYQKCENVDPYMFLIKLNEQTGEISFADGNYILKVLNYNEATGSSLTLKMTKNDNPNLKDGVYSLVRAQ